MMGIPVELPTYVFGDNKAMLTNKCAPHSVLKKKSSSIPYHFVCEGVAKDAWHTAYLNTDLHPADISAWRNQKNKVYILSIVLCGMMSFRGVQYLYHLPRFADNTSFKVE